MNPIISSELTLLAQEIQRFLSPIVLKEIAKKVGFVQQSSKYQADELIALCVWLSQEIASTSLTQLCSRLESSTGVLISPEGLNQRFNPAAVAFLRKVFTSLLKQKLCLNHSLSSDLISAFNRIRILDALYFSYRIPSLQIIKDLEGVVILQGYGQLIGILICSSTMFQMRQLLLEKKKQELSEYKAIYMIKNYLPLIFQAMAVGTGGLLNILHRLYQLLKKNGRKCHPL